MSWIHMFAIALGLGVATLATAQGAQTAPPALHRTPAAAAASKADRREAIKPGDRNCLHDTGSLIPAKKGQCLQGAFGRSYSARELRSTGQQDIAGALRMLDPAIH